MRLDLRAIALTGVLEEVQSQVRERLAGRSLQLTVELPKDLPQVQADPIRLTQIFVELLDNACKYTPPEGQILLQAQVKDGNVHCTVADAGIGISKEDQANLFTKFFRSDHPTVREMPGTGLGLCVVKGLVELGGGEIKIESQLEAGTTITFTVPIAEAEPAQEPAVG
ncbi:MAG TPA: ATP-binding protein [Chloroflexi bacterium]|mgnify:CR=1 FL=1|nr:ATP-binding protein [Chloroflexota bacterium]